MTLCFSTILCLLLVLLHSNSASESLDELTQAHNEFGLDLYRKLNEMSIPHNPNDNIVLSPFSIAIGLSMLLEGSGGDTASQLKSALHLDSMKDNLEWLEASQRLLESLHVGESEHGGNLTLALANKLFYDKSAQVKQEYREDLKNYFFADIEDLDFEHKSDEARDYINSWIEEKTMHKIKRMLPKEAIDFQTRFVLTNALYLKSIWKTQFTLETRRVPFYLSEGSTVHVEMMNAEHEFPYRYDSDLSATVVEVPYAVDSLQFIVVVPDEKSGLETVEAKMTPYHLNEWLTMVPTSQKVVLRLPRFRVESSFALTKALKELGADDVFDTAKADLSGVFEENQLLLALTHVLHKVFVEVNENGTEAAAATSSVASSRMAGGNDPIKIMVDRPSLFFIADRSSHAVLFMGRLGSPMYASSSRMLFLDEPPEIDLKPSTTSVTSKPVLGKKDDKPIRSHAVDHVNLHTETSSHRTPSTVRQIGKFGATLLHMASRNGNVEEVTSLLKEGVRVNATDSIGATPLHEASHFGHVEIVTLLLDHGANVNAKREQGVTPLHEAVLYGKDDVVAVLLKRGANSNVKTSLGETPLDIATRMKHDNIIKLLQNAGNRSATSSSHRSNHHSASSMH